MKPYESDYLNAPNTTISDYARRWGIETLKTRGFCLEATHLKDQERLKKLIALLTLAFCWAHRVGEWIVEHCPIKVNHLRQILLNLDTYHGQYV